MDLYTQLINKKQPKILIIRMSSFGDIVKTIPVYFYIKKVLPESKIYWLIKEKYTELLSLFRINDFLIYKHLKAMRNFYFDAVFDFQGNLKSGFLTFITPAKYKIGFTHRYTKELNILFYNIPLNNILFCGGVLKNVNLNKLTVNTYAKPFMLLYKVGFPYTTDPLPCKPLISPAKELFVKEWLGSKNIKKFVLIHPGSSRKGAYKRWKIENFLRLVKELKDICNIPSVILLGEGEKEEKATFEDYGLIPEFEVKLEEMVVLIRNCLLFIGNDSGPLHLASILKAKTIGIFPASNPNIMAHPQTFAISHFFYPVEKYTKSMVKPIEYEVVWNKVKKLLERIS